MYLLIIIPCFNEEDTLGDVIDRIPSCIDGVDRTDVVVIDDGSTDDSVNIAQERGVEVFRHSINMGVGRAFHSGVEIAIRRRADVVVNIDGDGQFDPKEIGRLLPPIINGNADCVSASRFKDKNLVPTMPFAKRWGNWAMAFLISRLARQRFYDVACGFRAYSREALLQLNLFGQFTYTQETILDLVFKGLRIQEVPLEVRGERQYGSSRVASSLLTYALKTGRIILRTFRDFKPLRFFFMLGFVILLLAGGLAIFFFGHYFLSGAFTPHLWAGFTAGFLVVVSLMFFVTGLLADMFERIRRNLDTLLYFEKKRLGEKNHADDTSSEGEK